MPERLNESLSPLLKNAARRRTLIIHSLCKTNQSKPLKITPLSRAAMPRSSSKFPQKALGGGTRTGKYSSASLFSNFLRTRRELRQYYDWNQKRGLEACTIYLSSQQKSGADDVLLHLLTEKEVSQRWKRRGAEVEPASEPLSSHLCQVTSRVLVLAPLMHTGA